jgi:uncharacterized protein with HEPN domain
MKTDFAYLKHILDSIEKIGRYLGVFSFEAFSQNDMLISAVTRELEIIGEAAGKVSQETKNKHPELPWPEMIGMRHKLIHDYFNVDLKIVWDTCRNNLPDLKAKLIPAVEKLGQN